MKALDITLQGDYAGETAIPASTKMRVYESSVPGQVTVVLYSYDGMDAATRISRSSALALFYALGDFLVATGADVSEVTA